jgi:hypothetical protein
MTDTVPDSRDRHDVQARVDELLSQMSQDEKAGQLTQYFSFRLPAGAEVDLSFSLIRGRSAGFVISCHACNRRRAV